MPRFFQPDATIQSDEVVLVGAEANHAARVLRVREGEIVEVLNGRGLRLSGTVTGVTKTAVRIAMTDRIEEAPPAVSIVLFQSLLKGKHFDLVLQKATELGADEIVPVITDRVIARPKASEFADRREKWQQAVIEATKQCGAAWCPQVRPPTPFAEAIQPPVTENSLHLVASLQVDAVHPRAVLGDYFRLPAAKNSAVAIWIGPEGDFTDAEYAALLAAGVRPVSFGRLVLRSETAALHALSILNYERGGAGDVEPAP